MTDTSRNDIERDEQHLASLIRQAGAREQPPPPVTATVREAVAAEWRDMVAARARRRTLATRWSAAAAVVVAGMAVWLALPRLQPEAALVASLVRVSGPVQISDGGLVARWGAAQAGAVAGRNAEIRSAAGGRVALQVGTISVRLDENSVVAMLAPDRIALRRGAIYLDADPSQGPGSPLIVETAFGNVAHLGTQYETRVDEDGLRVRVREGRVMLSIGEQAVEGLAGQQLTVLSSGDMSRGTVSRADGAWAWIETIAPDYDINDRPLLEFLRWVSRETGRELSFGSPQSEQVARDMVLRGSVKNMSPRQALAAVLTTTELQGRDDGAGLRIDFKTGD